MGGGTLVLVVVLLPVVLDLRRLSHGRHRCRHHHQMGERNLHLPLLCVRAV